MKKYFLNDGKTQQGPFDIAELKTKNITPQTPIWHEGLPNWTVAGNVEELKDLFKIVTPPPFIQQSPPPFVPQPQQQAIPKSSTYQKASIEKSRSSRTPFFIVGGVITFLIILYVIRSNHNSNRSNLVEGQSYNEKVMSIEETELSQPVRFLSAAGVYNSNLWGDVFKVHGTITNTATAATFKDAVVKVTYYSKTKTVLTSKVYTIYDFFPPHETKNFELKISNYQDVSTIGWEVINAQPN
jgi:hypothetical protein